MRGLGGRVGVLGLEMREDLRVLLRPQPFVVVDEVVTVEDDAIIDAVLWLFESARIVAEPSGAATVAAAFAGAADGVTVAIVSGGNIDLEKLQEWKRQMQRP